VINILRKGNVGTDVMEHGVNHELFLMVICAYAKELGFKHGVEYVLS